MNWIWRSLRKERSTPDGRDFGYSLLELIIGITITFLISAGVFQLIRIGYNAVSNNADSASQNGFSSTFSTLFRGDISHSDGLVISSATNKTDLTNICTSWKPSADPTFTKVRPLFTVAVSHSAAIESITAYQNAANAGTYTNTYIFHTLDEPDFEVGETLKVTGFTAFDVAAGVTTNLDFNITTDKDLLITNVDSAGRSFTVQDPLSDNLVSTSPQTFTSTTSALAQTNSYAGYELRAPLLSQGAATTSEIWRVFCPSLAQQTVKLKSSIRLRVGLPPIDTTLNSSCLLNGEKNWSDWSCAVRCPQFNSAILGSNFSPNSAICPKDVLISIGQRSFVGTSSSDEAFSSKTVYNPQTLLNESIIYIENLNRNVSNIRAGMTVDFPSLYNSNGTKKASVFVASVDLTDATYAIVTVSCGNIDCPVLPGLGMKVVVGAAIAVECASLPCSENSNVVDVKNTNQVKRGMYASIDGSTFPDYAVVGDQTSFGVQQLYLERSPIFSQYPSLQVMEFSQPTGLELWIPAAGAGSKLKAEKFLATREG